jgi:hypothetical protein
MTAEGTAFAEVANRMQETFAGRLAAIEAAFQNLAGAALESFNAVDKAMGGLVSGTMKLFAGGLNQIADKMDILVAALAALTAGLGAYAAVMVGLNWGAIAGAIGAIVTAIQGWIAAQTTLNVVTAFFAGLTGNWIGLAAGAAAAGIAVAVVAKNMGDVKGKTGEATGAVEGLTEKVGVLNEEELKASNFSGRVEQYKAARKEADEYKVALDMELEKLEAVKTALTEKHKEDVQGHKDAIAAIKEKLQEERASLSEAKAGIKAKYDEEKGELNETLTLIREKYAEEIGALQEMGPYQQQLYDLEKKKLQESIASGKLDAEAVLRAQARLERMEQQEQIAKLRKKQAEEEAPVLKALEELEADRKKKIDATTKAHTDRIKALESDQGKEEAALKRTEDAYKRQIKMIDDTAKAAKEIGPAVDTAAPAINDQITQVNALAGKWKAAETAAIEYAAAVRAANRAKGQKSSGGGSTPTTSNFAGGPISAGTTSWVNELGKEAFLTASGRLSMINDKGGKWTAPANGTIIPAHLTKQLNIPQGGININKGASQATSSAAAGGTNLNRLASAIAGSMRGDNVNNNVTIQSANPNKTANSVLVELAKLKRLRYN